MIINISGILTNGSRSSQWQFGDLIRCGFYSFCLHTSLCQEKAELDAHPIDGCAVRPIKSNDLFHWIGLIVSPIHYNFFIL